MTEPLNEGVSRLFAIKIYAKLLFSAVSRITALPTWLFVVVAQLPRQCVEGRLSVPSSGHVGIHSGQVDGDVFHAPDWSSLSCRTNVHLGNYSNGQINLYQDLCGS